MFFSVRTFNHVGFGMLRLFVLLSTENFPVRKGVPKINYFWLLNKSLVANYYHAGYYHACINY